MKKRVGVGCIAVILGCLLILNGNRDKRQENSEANFIFIAPKKWNRISQGIRDAGEDFGVNTKYVALSKKTEEMQAEAIQYAIL